jgi:hypothetical protein
MAADSYSYRVWADGTGLRTPWDGPRARPCRPHPTGLPNFLAPAFVPPALVSLQNGPIATNDPWLPPGATQTTGNNVDAYADLAVPDGFSAGDLRAATTGTNAFDRVYDTALPRTASDSQKMAGVTQLFYVNNWLHDWFYGSGFTETSGNAQASNYGRGGIQGDRLLVESQDYSGTNNANMTTPADGASPRMQMYRYFLQPLAPSPSTHGGDRGGQAGRDGELLPAIGHAQRRPAESEPVRHTVHGDGALWQRHRSGSRSPTSTAMPVPISSRRTLRRTASR